jgi:mRNA-degrading endonuclease RelE of RelBE toxin-antitoxin system
VANDTCIIRFLAGAQKAIRRIRKHDPDRMPFIDHALRTVVHNGWILSAHSGLIKVLDQRQHVGEIRDLGSGGYRLFFFWKDDESARTLFVTAIEKKSKLKGKARVNEFITAAAIRRRRYFEDWEESAE